jgi:hypothetical protein
MSMLNIACLNEAVSARDLTGPAEILDYTRARIMEHMANDGSPEGGKDGMDAVLARFDIKNLSLEFCAANNPLWLLREGKVLEYQPDKMPVGKPMGAIKPFNSQRIKLKKGDVVVMITDGFADQFGGPKGKKFMYRALKELVANCATLPVAQISEKLGRAFEEWKGTYEQRVIGPSHRFNNLLGLLSSEDFVKIKCCPPPESILPDGEIFYLCML